MGSKSMRPAALRDDIMSPGLVSQTIACRIFGCLPIDIGPVDLVHTVVTPWSDGFWC